ncbi:DUF6884 domain-containing protein [Sorangium sp. So ce362]|uniref:DUF6884 domain-containing protein n=1 Tax=Sorangium sp. So ce362 TaxID=3133303 RepID=UPI003F5F0C2D
MFTEKLPGAPRVTLVGCSALKRKRPPPAKDFYTSTLFRAAYEYAEKTCDVVLIVSAFYGAVSPKTVLHPYDRNLREFRKSEREGCGVRTIGELLPSFRAPSQLVILAGEIYADALLHGAHWQPLPQRYCFEQRRQRPRVCAGSRSSRALRIASFAPCTARVRASASEATTADRGERSSGVSVPGPRPGGRPRVGTMPSEEPRSVVTCPEIPAESDGSRRFGTADSSRRIAPVRHRNFVLGGICGWDSV